MVKFSSVQFRALLPELRTELRVQFGPEAEPEPELRVQFGVRTGSNPELLPYKARVRVNKPINPNLN